MNKKIQDDMKKIGCTILFFIFVMIIASFIPSGLKTDNSHNINKVFCNSITNICKGVILDTKPCATSPSLECYLVDFGEGYSRDLEVPVSSGHAIINNK